MPNPPPSKSAIGLGLRVPHYRHIMSHWPEVDFFEVISENFMVDGGPPLQNLDKILSHYLVVQHGVSMGIGSSQPLDFEYLKRLKRLTERTQTPYFTDHLCWTNAHGIQLHELLPLPYTDKVARFVAEKVARVQDYIGLPFGLENLSSYVAFKASEMTEWEFYNRIVELSGCYYMLDINNIWVSAVNHAFDPREYVRSIRWDRVLQSHIAGHTKNDNGTILDTHDQDVCVDVWELYRYAWEHSGGFPTLLERDGNIPPFSEVFAEAQHAKVVRSSTATITGLSGREEVAEVSKVQGIRS